MPSSKGARATQPKHTLAEIQAFKKRQSWCDPCQRDFGNLGGLKSHSKHKHSARQEPEQTASARAGAADQAAPPSSLVTFYCRKAPQMRIIFEPERRKMVGENLEQVPGTDIQFDGGVFRTDDEHIIAFLEGDVAEARRLGMKDRRGASRIYRDARYPIVSDRQLSDAARMREVHAANAPRPALTPERGSEFKPSPVVGEGFRGSLLHSD